MGKEIFKIGVSGLSFTSGATTISGVLADRLFKEIEKPIYYISSFDKMELGLSKVLKNMLSYKGVIYEDVDYINPEGVMIFDDISLEKMSEMDVNIIVVSAYPIRLMPFLEKLKKIQETYPDVIILVNHFSDGVSLRLLKTLLGKDFIIQNEIDIAKMQSALYEMRPILSLEGWDGVDILAGKCAKFYTQHFVDF